MPPNKRAARYLITALFLAAAAVILNLRATGPHLKAGESAAQSMDSMSPSGIERLVHDIVERRLKDKQLDECRMNITDIRRAEKSLVRSLTAIAHPRIRYPAPTT
jgi:hypothetical protein